MRWHIMAAIVERIVMIFYDSLLALPNLRPERLSADIKQRWQRFLK